jgi:hypothetical protein
MTWRVTIYGWVMKKDPVHGWGSGSLVDLVYFITDQVRYEDVLAIIKQANFKILAKGKTDENGHQIYDASGKRILEQDKVIIENWDDHLKVGVEKMESVKFQENQGQFDRYNYPYRGGM